MQPERGVVFAGGSGWAPNPSPVRSIRGAISRRAAGRTLSRVHHMPVRYCCTTGIVPSLRAVWGYVDLLTRLIGRRENEL